MDSDRPTAFEAGAALVAGLAAGGVAVAFRSATLLPAGFFDGLAAACVGLGAAPLASRHLGAPAAPLTRGVGLALGALLVASSLVPPFERAAHPLVAWILGGALLQAGTRATRNGIVLSSLGVVLVGVGCAIAWYAATAVPEPERLRWTLAGAATLAALGLVARRLLARRAPRLAPAPAGILLGATLAATYVGYRPLVAGEVGNLPLYEWTLGVGVAALLLGRMRRSARDASVPEAWTGSARRHAQDAPPVYDPRMPALAAVVQRYLESGEGFAEYRAALLRAAAHAPPTFRKTLEGMNAVQARGRASKRARADRLAAHQQLMEILERTHGHPTPAVRTHP
ncbi:MAG TPA: hypothetical protein VFH78_09360 [Candidatus Thermoplasmatota archaeon]|nr:hypothetical protein [Candidatus Thermoplasmatota archaeon]